MLACAVALIALADTALAQRGGRGAAGPPATLESQADRIFAQFNSTHTPGCAVGVRQAGRDLLLKGYGMANLEAGVPISAGTIFESGSVAKQFTATAILMLVRDGKLSLDDPVRKHIPELPEYPRPLLVRHLLSHTSGLREWSNLVALAGWPRTTRVHTQQDLLETVFAQKSLNYPVGDHYSYTNSGFALLPTIVERVSGMSFVQFSNERIFRPLGLRDTHWRDDFTEIVPGRAQAYSRAANAPRGWSLEMPFENVHGPGGLLTTVADWLRWNDELDKKNLVSSEIVDGLTTRAVLTSGRTISYARGVTVSKFRGVDEIAHSGSTGGYSTYLARYPGQQLSIAVLCNAAGAPATQFTRSLVEALVPSLAPVASADTVAAEAGEVAKIAGIYRNARTHEIQPVGTGAGFAGAPVRKLRDGGWMIGNNRALVDFGPDGNARGYRALAADSDSVPFTLVAKEQWKPTPAQLAAFAGRYRSDEIPAVWTLTVEGDRLVASVRGALKGTLTPVYPDGFTGGGTLGSVWFTRDARGAVTEMHSGSSRVWDIAFQRVRP